MFIIFKKVNEVLAKVDPNDLQDIESDDEEQLATNDINTTDGKCQYFNYFQLFLLFFPQKVFVFIRFYVFWMENTHKEQRTHQNSQKTV